MVDHGRHLIVDSADPPERPSKRPPPAGGVEPLPVDAIIVDRPCHGRGPRRPGDARTAGGAVPAGVREHLLWLVGRGTRHSLSAGFASGRLGRRRLTWLGYTTSRPAITVGPGTARTSSRTARAPPTAPVTSSSSPRTWTPSTSPAGRAARPRRRRQRQRVGRPAGAGAASWPAGVAHDLRLILFGGEEEGLYGSTHTSPARSRPPSGRGSGAVLNMDMVAPAEHRAAHRAARGCRRLVQA